MKKITKPFWYILFALGSLILIGIFVNTILIASNRSDYAAITVYGSTPKRVWATLSAFLALVGIVSGKLSFVQSRNTHTKKLKAIIALLFGGVAIINGVINLSVATGGPGSGNGVVGAALAIVLGIVSVIVGLFAFHSFQNTK